MATNDKKILQFEGPRGALPIKVDDIFASRFAMLYEGKCTALGPEKAAAKYGYTRQRFYQLLKVYLKDGSDALHIKKTGPKKKSVRTDNIVNQIIRHRFLDPDAGAEVIAQKLNQTGIQISKRSVEMTITEQGLQKKTSIASAPKKSRKK